MADELYDRIGVGYMRTRRPDPRIEAAIHAALGDARSVVNVGAGTGSYEPRDRDVTAVEPSPVMRAQRPPGAPAAIPADAEDLPFADDSFDAAMAIFTDHHWRDRARGLRELRRVARGRVVLLNADPVQVIGFWLTREYLPEFAELIDHRYHVPGAWEAELEALLGPLRLVAVPLRHDCTDGFYGAFWRRPRAYLEPTVRAGISFFAALPDALVEAAMSSLRDDLESGAWAARHADLLARDELDLGYRVVVAGSG